VTAAEAAGWGGLADLNSISDPRFERLEEQLDSQREEIERLRRTIDAFIPVDVDTGLLNRNGLIDSIKRACLWWERRREPFGVLVLQIPGLAFAPSEQRQPLAMIVANSMIGTLRAVDDSGRLNESTYAAVLRDFVREGGPIVAARLRTALRTALGAEQGIATDLRIGMSVVVEGTTREPSHYLDVASQAAEQALFDRARVIDG
jgi:GGDEF domain-containing protein